MLSQFREGWSRSGQGPGRGGSAAEVRDVRRLGLCRRQPPSGEVASPWLEPTSAESERGPVKD